MVLRKGSSCINHHHVNNSRHDLQGLERIFCDTFHRYEKCLQFSRLVAAAHVFSNENAGGVFQLGRGAWETRR